MLFRSASTHGEHEALLVGFLSALMPRLQAGLHGTLTEFGKSADVILLSLKKWLDIQGHPSEHAQYQLATTLEKWVQEGLALRHDPYEVTVQALSPQGFPVTIHVRKSQQADLIAMLPALCSWLAEQGYAVPSPAGTF